LPYLAQIDENTLLLRDGRLMQVLTLDGLLFETADTEEINYRKVLRDAMLQAIGTSRFALYHHVVRRRVEPQLDASFPDPFSAQVDANWRRRLESKRLFTNDLFIALIRRPLQGAAASPTASRAVRAGLGGQLGGQFRRRAARARCGARCLARGAQPIWRAHARHL
jgi:type IV secretion system protein VirB4